MDELVVTEEDIKKLMDMYGDYIYRKDLLQAEKKSIIKKIIPPEIQTELDSVDAEFIDKEKALDEQEKSARSLLDGAVERFIENLKLIDKTTLKSKLMTLSITRGEIKWDAKSLDGFAIAGHPEILSFRKEESPKTRLVRNKF